METQLKNETETREYIGGIFGLYGDNDLGYMGIMEKKMETTIMGYIGFRVLRFRV